MSMPLLLLSTTSSLSHTLLFFLFFSLPFWPLVHQWFPPPGDAQTRSLIVRESSSIHAPPSYHKQTCGSPSPGRSETQSAHLVVTLTDHTRQSGILPQSWWRHRSVFCKLRQWREGENKGLREVSKSWLTEDWVDVSVGGVEVWRSS